MLCSPAAYFKKHGHSSSWSQGAKLAEKLWGSKEDLVPYRQPASSIPSSQMSEDNPGTLKKKKKKKKMMMMMMMMMVMMMMIMMMWRTG